jgi:hypothetical protein
MATVLLSIFAHGLTALPGITRYGRQIASLPKDAPEFQAVDAGGGTPEQREGHTA